MKQELLTQIQHRIEQNFPEQIEFHKSLIRFRSTLLGEELPMQQAMAKKLTSLGFSVDMFDIDVEKLKNHPGYSPCPWSTKGRPQVVGVLKGAHQKGGKSIVLNGHADVVSADPEDHWHYPPWEGTVVGNRLYGRGASDMKCGLASIVYAVKALLDEGIQLDGDVIVQSVLEEECSGNGTLACIERGYVGDACLIAECNDLKLLTSSVGSLWLKVKVNGKAGHVTEGENTKNAILLMQDVINAFLELETFLNLPEQKHPAFREFAKPISINIGQIEGGNWPSSVPAQCELHVRIGVYPDVTQQEAQNMTQQFICRVLKSNGWKEDEMPVFCWYAHRNQGFDVPTNNSFFEALDHAHQLVFHDKVKYNKVTACNDMRFWALYTNVPATMYGGYGYNMHAADEYVDLPSVCNATKVIACLLLNWCKQV